MKSLGIEPSERVQALLRDHFGVAEIPGDGPPWVPVESHLEFARRLREELGFSVFLYVVASHWPAAAQGTAAGAAGHFEVAYGLRRPSCPSEAASWRLRVPQGQAVPSLVPLFAGADWQEREQYDLVGVTFDGHPDLRRLMLPEDWQGHPLQKDYPIDQPCPPWR